MSFGGLDIGTSGCKCTLFNDDGKQLAVSYRAYKAVRSMGHHEIDTTAIWESVKTVIAEAAAKAGDPPEAISVSSFGESCALLDENDTPVIPAILYTDPRGQEEAALLEKEPGEHHIYKISGLAPDFTYTLPKLMWIRKHLPEAMAQVEKILPIASFITYCLTGETVTDPSLASRTMMLDVKKLSWNEDLLAQAGLSPDIMPEIVEIGSIAGTIKKVLAEELGIPKTMKVVTGAHDQVVSAIGAGVLDSGTAANSSGSVECITPIFRSVKDTDSLLRNKYPTVPMLKDRYTTYLTIFSSGTLLQWFRDNFAGSQQKTAAENGKDIFAYLDLTGQLEPTGILVLPHFTGSASPYYDPDSTGAITGLTLEHTPGDIYKALQEGICYESALNLDLLAGAGIKIDHLRIVGGGERSRRWNQMKADIYGIPCATLKAGEAGATGSAMLAGVALGKYSSLEQAVSALVEEKETYTPRREYTEAYASYFSKYKKLYHALKSIEDRE